MDILLYNRNNLISYAGIFLRLLMNYCGLDYGDGHNMITTYKKYEDTSTNMGCNNSWFPGKTKPEGHQDVFKTWKLDIRWFCRCFRSFLAFESDWSPISVLKAVVLGQMRSILLKRLPFPRFPSIFVSFCVEIHSKSCSWLNFPLKRMVKCKILLWLY